MAFCLIVGVAAVVAPLLVLFGLRYGVVESLRDNLRRNPTSLELRLLTQGRFGRAFLDALAARPGVGYLEPTPRFLSTIVTLSSSTQPEGADPVEVDMLPSRQGDPLLGDAVMAAPPPDGLILSEPAAERLSVAAGDVVTAWIARVYRETHERITRKLVVAAVLPLDRLNREAALIDPAFILASEDYLEGRASAYLGTNGTPPDGSERLFAGFRLYAADIDSVEPLREWLVAQGLRVDTAAAQIRLIRNFDKALGALFLVVALLGGLGAVLGLAVSLWANVERKRHELGILRLMGFRSMALAIFPMTQGLVIGFAGSAISAGLAVLAGPATQRVLAGTVAEGLVTYRLPLWAIGGAAFLVSTSALLAAGAAGSVAARLDPADTLRRV
jgi:putative ABC transport system permease protein